MNHIPVIDISALGGGDQRADCVAEIMAACRDIGFLCITGTGVDPALITRMRATVEEIFAVPEQDKWAQAITPANYRGYIPLGFFTPNDGSGTPDR